MGQIHIQALHVRTTILSKIKIFYTLTSVKIQTQNGANAINAGFSDFRGVPEDFW